MKTICTAARLQYTDDSTELVLTLQADRKTAQKGIQELREVLAKGKLLQAEIRQYRKHRSLDANNFCWVLCQRIAEVAGSTKELVYREFIRRCGQFEIIPLKNEAVEKWIQNWQAHGIGWVSEVMGESKIDGYTNVISYYGSSTYTVSEMSVLLNDIVQECKSLEIETANPQEIQSLLLEWGK